MIKKTIMLLIPVIFLLYLTYGTVYAMEKPLWQAAYRQVLEKEISRGDYNYFTLIDMNKDNVPELIMAYDKISRYETIRSDGAFVDGKGPMIIYTFKEGEAEVSHRYPHDVTKKFAHYDATLMLRVDKETQELIFNVFIDYSYKDGRDQSFMLTLDGLNVVRQTPKDSENFYYNAFAIYAKSMDIGFKRTIKSILTILIL